MNLCVLKGRMVKDAEIRYSNGGNPMAIVNFTVACQRIKKDDGADFISCTAFGKTAETIEKYVKKGNEVAIIGHWQTGSYTNKDGNKVYTNTCIVDKFEFCSGKSDKTSGNDTSTPADAEFLNVPDNLDDIPFN